MTAARNFHDRLLVATVAAGIVIVWRYRTTGKSTVLAIVVHDMIEVTGSLFPNCPVCEPE